MHFRWNTHYYRPKKHGITELEQSYPQESKIIQGQEAKAQELISKRADGAILILLVLSISRGKKEVCLFPFMIL